MGVSTTTNRLTYAGTGAQVTFAFGYYFFAQADLLVFVYDTLAGGITSKTLNTDYTITGTANSQGLYPNGGSVVFGTAPLSTDIVVIIRNPSLIQNYALLQNGNISSTAIVQQFDYLTLLMQRMQDQINRCVAVPDGVGSSFSGQLPSTLALVASELAYLQINNNANGMALSNTVPSFSTVVVPYTSVQTTSTVNQVSLFTLPASAVLTSLFIKHTTAFAGTSITAVLSDIGISTDYSKFINKFDVLQAVGDAVFESVMLQYLGSWANSKTIYLQVTSTGANLSALSAGSLNVYYSYTIL